MSLLFFSRRSLTIFFASSSRRCNTRGCHVLQLPVGHVGCLGRVFSHFLSTLTTKTQRHQERQTLVVIPMKMGIPVFYSFHSVFSFNLFPFSPFNFTTGGIRLWRDLRRGPQGFVKIRALSWPREKNKDSRFPLRLGSVTLCGDMSFFFIRMIRCHAR